MSHEEAIPLPSWSKSRVTRLTREGIILYHKQYQEKPEEGLTHDIILERVLNELRLLYRLNQTHFHPSLGVPRLIDGNPEQGVIITQEVSGTRLDKYLTGSFSRKVDYACLKVFFLAGRWLREFQLLPLDPNDLARSNNYGTLDLPAYCELRIRKIRQSSPLWVDEQLAREIISILSGPSALSLKGQKLVLSHGDYAAHNIIWDGVKLTPIDFGMTSIDYPLSDVTYFIHRLEMLPIYFPWRRWPVSQWRQAFLRGYGAPQAGMDATYHLLMIRHLLCRLRTYTNRQQSDWVDKIHAYWICRKLTFAIRNRLSLLQKQASC